MADLAYISDSIPQEEEEWRPVVGWEDLYAVSNWGRVKRLERHVHSASPIGKKAYDRVYRERPLRASPHPRYRYPRVGLIARDGSKSEIYVHTLVCAAFHGPRPADAVVAHCDGSRTNNHASNLRWASRKENVQDAVKHGAIRRGAAHHHAKLSEQDVLYIRANPQGLTIARLAAVFSVSESHIMSIRARSIWKHV